MLSYTKDFFSRHVLKTRALKIGSLGIGGDFPILIQSMTNTNTLDTQATVEQCIRVIEAGGELVRITAQGIAEAENLKNIKTELLARNYHTPLAADIHFSPKAAEVAAKYVEKIRINPGNYAEKNKKLDYTDEEYEQALVLTAEKLQPLLKLAKKHKRIIRIGVNHGSLSSRIMSRYGNTAEGMVESAMEFIRIFEKADFFDIVLSLKSSHVLTMVHSNRLMVARMLERGRIYPLHLGVTEAGNDIEGRQKSIAGIATLLQDGIGDTLRVSLTEAPENEIPWAIALRESFSLSIPKESISEKKIWFDPFHFHKRSSQQIKNIGGSNPPLVFLSNTANEKEQHLDSERRVLNDQADYHFLNTTEANSKSAGKKFMVYYKQWNKEQSDVFPLLNKNELENVKMDLNQMFFVRLSSSELAKKEVCEKLRRYPMSVLILSSDSNYPVPEWRSAFYTLHAHHIEIPVILHRKFRSKSLDDLLLESSRTFSILLLDGLGDGIWMETEGNIFERDLARLSFGILQSCRLRMTHTDYIACPSCGRTLFNIEERLAEIREKTNFLKHLKIAVMGCIVNGLGEMADADYGYVGSSHGKVNLYKGKQLMQKNVNEEDACDALVHLIKEEGDWLPS